MHNDTHALQALVEQLTQRVAELESSVHRVEPPSTIERRTPSAVGRRGLMKAAAGAAVGGAAALVAMPSGRAAAANGDELVIGNRGPGEVGTQVATSPTQLNYTGTEDIGFVVQSGTAFSATSSSFDAALAGWTNRSIHPHGVYGFSGSATGANSAGVLGRTQASDSSGVLAISTTSSSDGVRALAPGGGVAVRATAGTGVRAVGGAVGVQASGSTAVAADGTVVGLAANGATAVVATGTVGVEARGSRAALFLPPAGTTAAPDLSDTHAAGEIRVNESVAAGEAEAWICVESGSPGTWRRLAGPATAGAFTAIEPGRGYDSRTPTPFRQILAGGEDRVVSVADARDLDTGAVTVADIVPAGATAIAYNLTVTNTTGGGFLAVTPGDATDFGAAAINWSAPDTTVGNAGIVKLDGSRQIKVFAGGGTTDFIVDITGFFL